MAPTPPTPPTLPTQVVFDTILEFTCKCIQRRTASILRNRAGRLLHNFAILNRECRDICRVEGLRYKAICYYERTRLCLGDFSGHDAEEVGVYFLRNLPQNLALFVGGVGDERTVYGLGGHQLMQTIENTGFPVSVFDNVPDFPNNIPLRVKYFISKLRHRAQKLASQAEPAQLKHCENRQCGRRFLDCDTRTPGHYRGNGVKLDCQWWVRESTFSTRVYFENAAVQPVYTDSHRRFCTSACQCEHQSQLDAFLPPAEPKMLRTEPARRERSTVAGCVGFNLDAALQRNKAFGEELKRRKAAAKRHGALSKRILRNEIGKRIDALNVDIGVLFHSSLLAKVHKEGDPPLPGLYDDWRDEQTHINVAKKIALVYEDAGEHKLITDLHGKNKFLSTIRALGARPV